MTQFINSQMPDIPRSGQSLQTASTPGRKVDFIQPTGLGYTSGTITSGSTLSITSAVQIWPEDLATILRDNSNMLGWNDVALWPFYNIFVDTDSDANFFFGTGASLTAAQKNITMAQYDHITPYTNQTLSTSFLFKNNDVSSHTIYFYAGAKYVITG